MRISDWSSDVCSSDLARPTQGALRLCAGLIVEAIRLKRIQQSLSDIDWDHVHDLLSTPDCERFVRFLEQRTPKGRTALVIQTAEKSGSAHRQKIGRAHV